MELIQCKNLYAGYNYTYALEGVSFDVAKGDYLCILGKNGSGKTTLIKCLLGLIAADKGKIIFSSGLKHRDIGYMPQETAIQRDFPASLREVVLSGFLGQKGLRPYYSAAEKSLAAEKIELLGLKALINKSFQELSGGQKQRVLLARALCGGKKLLVLDEPSRGLDPSLIRELYAIIAKINQKEGVTVIMVTHDINEGLNYANKILHLDTKALYFGPKGAYLQSPVYQAFKGGGENA